MLFTVDLAYTHSLSKCNNLHAKHLKKNPDGTLIGIAIALSAAPSGVKIFGEEQPVFWREAAAGHSSLAYFLGKNLSTLYRLTLCSAHFASIYILLARPTFSYEWQYGLLFCQFFCIYGVSSVVSSFVRRENASLLAVIFGMFMAVFNGYSPTLADANAGGYSFLYWILANRWSAEAQCKLFLCYKKPSINQQFFFQYLLDGLALKSYKNVYDMEVSLIYFGYELNVEWRNAYILVLLGIIYRAIAYIGMICMNRSKQR